MKPKNYLKDDWMWLLKKAKSRNGNWVCKWLSLGGRLTLIKSVLQNIHVYWLSIAKVPKFILNKNS